MVRVTVMSTPSAGSRGELAYALIDVFAEEPLTGNPLAVIPEASELDEDLMRRIAVGFNLSETTFVMARPCRERCGGCARSLRMGARCLARATTRRGSAGRAARPRRPDNRPAHRRGRAGPRARSPQPHRGRRHTRAGPAARIVRDGRRRPPVHLAFPSIQSSWRRLTKNLPKAVSGVASHPL